MPLENGDDFAGFVIERFLGSGAMGEVYLARHPRLPRVDALKVLPAALTDNADFRRRFEREADLAATLWHQHIVGIHDRGEFDGQLWISMDYVEGTDGGRLLSENYPTGMPLRDVFEIVTAVADALDFAHERQLLHRDVKPTNILLTSPKSNRRRILLADFGIARQADEVTGLTGTNMSVGSVGYAAPEQLMGERLDGRADQYGLAATAFHLLTGRMPFQHSNPAVVISKQLTAAVPRLSECRPDLANLDRVLSVALARDPNQRYPHCLDFARALRRENARSYTRPVATPADATRPSRSTTSTPDETRAIRLRPGAAPDETRAMNLRSGATEGVDEARAVKLRPDAGAAPDETKAMDFRKSAPSAPDETRAMRLPSGAGADETRAMRLPSGAAPDETRAMRLPSGAGADETRAMNLRPAAGAAPDETRAMRLPSGAGGDETRAMNLRPAAAAGADETRTMKLSPSATAPPQHPPHAAKPVSTPAVGRSAGRDTVAARPANNARRDIVGARPAGRGQPPRPVPKKSPDSDFSKAIWILVAVLVLIAAVIAAGVIWWKVAATGSPSLHPTVTKSSIPIGPGQVINQASSGATGCDISNHNVRSQTHITPAKELSTMRRF